MPTYTGTITVTDSKGKTGTTQVSIVETANPTNPPAPTVTGSVNPTSGPPGTTYEITGVGAGGTPPYTYAISQINGVTPTPVTGTPGKWTVQVSSGTGGTLPPPTGSPQFPHLLDVNSPSTQTYGRTYKVRPSWQAPGVDFYVGPDAGVALRDPWPGYPNNAASALHSALQGCTCSNGGAANGQIPTIDAPDGATIEGFDFGLHEGIRLGVPHNGIVQNNRFKTGLNSQNSRNVFGHAMHAFNASVYTITKNEIDGNGLKYASVGHSGKATVILDDDRGHGTKTITYNYFKNAPSLMIHIGFKQQSGGNNWIFENNLWENPGGCGADGDTITMIHGDVSQIECGSATEGANAYCIDLLRRRYNVFLFNQDQSKTISTPNPCKVNCALGWTAESHGRIVSRIFDDNVVIAVNNSYIGGIEHIDKTRLSGSGSISNNFTDLGGGSWFSSTSNESGNPGSYNGVVAQTNNVSLT